MKPSLLKILRCPECRAVLALRQESVVETGGEITDGVLKCSGCDAHYAIRDAIPRLASRSAVRPETERTSERFGYLWGQSEPSTGSARSYHFEKMAAALSLEAPRGFVLDAGCGDGIDLANHARRPGVEVIGVELSDGGCATSAARVRSMPNAHVVQADLLRLPFASDTFDRVYSYGVLHHTVSPPAAAAELARVVKPEEEIAIYLYEDFGERAAGWRMSLAAVNAFRALTTRLNPETLFRLCRAASPVVYATCTVPHRVFMQVPGLRRLGAGMPFRHGKSPFGLTGDLYDRFSAPIEFRYSRKSAGDLLQRAGLALMKVSYDRGWMVRARKSVGVAANG